MGIYYLALFALTSAATVTSASFVWLERRAAEWADSSISPGRRVPLDQLASLSELPDKTRRAWERRISLLERVSLLFYLGRCLMPRKRTRPTGYRRLRSPPGTRSP
ncbi:MAG: hypothetical protein AAF085_10350 [Planctomycetota bacterium]